MRYELLTQCAFFCIRVNGKKGMLNQHFVMRVVPPLMVTNPLHMFRHIAPTGRTLKLKAKP